MAEKIKHITAAEVEAYGVVAAPDVLNGPPGDNKAIFDRLVRELVVVSVNAVIDRLNVLMDVETVREEQEAGRQEAETVRVTAETARETAEHGRETAEGKRTEAETERASAEEERILTENARKAAEEGRSEAEQGRQTAEQTRAAAERERVSAEGERILAENARKTAEAAREAEEERRKSAEQSRAAAETARDQAEQERVAAEQLRVSETEGVVARAGAKADIAAAAAEAAADSAAQVQTLTQENVAAALAAQESKDAAAWSAQSAEASKEEAKQWAEQAKEVAGGNFATEEGVEAAVSDHDGDTEAHKALLAAKQDKITVTGLLKGDGEGGVTAAVPGEDYSLQGADGVTPDVQVGTVTTLPAGSAATVTRREGSPDAAPVFDFGLPRGADAVNPGDMTKALYDPQGKHQDVFAYADQKMPKTGGAFTGIVSGISPTGGNTKGFRNIYFGSGTPASSLGANGDIYINIG